MAFDKPSALTFCLFVFVIVFAVAVVALSFWNTTAMEHDSRQNSEEYVLEITSQIAGTVSTNQTDLKNTLTGLASGMEMLLADNIEETSSGSYLQNYLETVSNSDQYDFLSYLAKDGTRIDVGAVPSDISDSLDESAKVVEEAQITGACVAYVESDMVLYATPVYNSNVITGTLVAGTSTTDMMDLINMQTYRDERNFCITNLEGKGLIESSDGRMEDLKATLEDGSDASNQHLSELTEAFTQGQSGLLTIKLSDGKTYFLSYAPIDGEDWMLLTLLPTDLFSGMYISYMQRALLAAVGTAAIFMILVAMMVISNNKARRHLETIAFTEELTGGPNNAEFHHRYNQMSRIDDPRNYCIVMLDIKDFKLVNESAGFSVGDKLLCHVYQCVNDELDPRQHEFAARTETDHYIICLHENEEAAVQQRIDAITDRVNQNSPTAIFGFRVEFKQGACIVTDERESITSLAEHARLARKNMDRDAINRCTFYTKELNETLHKAHRLDHMAEKSMQNHDFVVYFQPKVSISTGQVKGAEALVRWQHPEYGLISPADFIPVLEESGRIQALDRYVFNEVCRWLAAREAAGKRMFPVSVNLSRAHFWNSGFLDDYIAIADAHHVECSYLEFEITETVFMEDSKLAKVKEGIKHMHDHGFRIAVDDFGVGYSSLSLVSEMEVDTLKFDRSFFTDLDSEKAQKVAHCLISMASELQMGMVIEGIETQRQIEYLQQERCDVVQGFYYSRPLPEAEFDAWTDASDNHATAANNQGQ